MHPITYALVFQSFNTHRIVMNRKEAAGKTKALAIAKVHTADAVNDVLRDITHQSEVRRIYKRLLSAYLAAHYMKHTYKQGVPPRLLALLNSPITTQKNVEGTNIEPASGQEFNSKKVCLGARCAGP